MLLVGIPLVWAQIAAPGLLPVGFPLVWAQIAAPGLLLVGIPLVRGVRSGRK